MYQNDKTAYIRGMPKRMRVDIDEIRRENLRAVAARLGGNAKLAVATGKSDSQISQIIGTNPTRGIGDELAREMEESLELDKFALDLAPFRYSELIEEIAELLESRSNAAQASVLEIVKQFPAEDQRSRHPIHAKDRRANP
jgi:hypothetical protein